MPACHTLTVRLPAGVYKAAKRLAEREGVSLNRIVQDALAEKAERSVTARVRKAYDVLAGDAAGADVENLLAVQAEVLLDG